MIDPQTVDPLALSSVPLKDRRLLPASSGITFAIDGNNTIIHISSSINCKRLWKNHHHIKKLKRIKSLRIACLLVADATDLPALKLELLKRFEPFLNKSYCRKTEKPGYKILEVPIRKETAIRLKKTCLKHRRYIGDVVESLINGWLEADHKDAG